MRFANGLRQWPAIARQAVGHWIDDYAPSMGAALAYYTLFSMAPLLLIVVSLAGLVFGEEAARGQVFTQLAGLVGADGAQALEALLRDVNKPATGLLATLFGLGALFVGATTVFAELKDAMDRIWHCPPDAPGSGLLGFLRTRLLSFGMILGIGFRLIVSLVISAGLAALNTIWNPWLGPWIPVAELLNFVLSFATLTCLFAMIYKWMPRVRLQWRDVWTGAAITALLFNLGKWLVGLYIAKSAVASGFGAAASLIVVVLWVYYSAQIFLLGAEFTRAFAQQVGSRTGKEPPAPAAVPRRSHAG